MNKDVSRDLSRGSLAFLRYAWPAVAHLCGDGELKPVESTVAEGFVRDLDVLAGIDGWQLLRDRGYMRGIASRMQESSKSWRTFTIRRSRITGACTEFEKRVKAIRERDNGALYPHLTIQGYVRTWAGGPLLGAGVARTVDLYEHAAAHEAELPWKTAGNATFYIVSWDSLTRAGIRVGEVRK